MEKNRSQFFRDFAAPLCGANRLGSNVSQGLRNTFWLQGMMGGLKNECECIKAFSEADITGDLEQMDVPTLVLQGGDDQVVPFGQAGKLQAEFVRNATLKVYAGAPHGMCSTHKNQVSADLLAFIGG